MSDKTTGFDFGNSLPPEFSPLKCLNFNSDFVRRFQWDESGFGNKSSGFDPFGAVGLGSIVPSK